MRKSDTIIVYDTGGCFLNIQRDFSFKKKKKRKENFFFFSKRHYPDIWFLFLKETVSFNLQRRCKSYSIKMGSGCTMSKKF